MCFPWSLSTKRRNPQLSRGRNDKEFPEGAHTMLQGDLTLPLEPSGFRFLISTKYDRYAQLKGDSNEKKC
jgi:hypothetical protein